MSNDPNVLVRRAAFESAILLSTLRHSLVSLPDARAAAQALNKTIQTLTNALDRDVRYSESEIADALARLRYPVKIEDERGDGSLYSWTVSVGDGRELSGTNDTFLQALCDVIEALQECARGEWGGEKA